MTQIKMPVTVFDAMVKVARRKLDPAKNIIIEDDGLFFKILAENYAGDTELASRGTKSPTTVQRTRNETG